MNSPIPNQYDVENAAFLAGVAAAAYQPQPELAGWKTAIAASTATDTRVLIACDGEDCVVAFRGTQDLRNWLTDLDCAFARLGRLRVHRGFYEALESVRADLEAEIQSTRCQRLWLTGHSLGGALAMLFAWIWNGPVEGIYTFGQPRAGDAAFARDFNDRWRERTFRVIRADDIVPRVPWLLGAYRHAGHEIFFPFPFGREIGGEGGVFPSPPERGIKGEGGWLQDCGLLTKLPFDLYNAIYEFRHGKLALLDDHHISRYLALFPTSIGTGPVSRSSTQALKTPVTS
jgi:pimeloyl-ACP methyl ester carboxylesterase